MEQLFRNFFPLIDAKPGTLQLLAHFCNLARISAEVSPGTTLICKFGKNSEMCLVGR